MKIKITDGPKARAEAQTGAELTEAATRVASILAFVTVTGAGFWWLVPVATRRAVPMTFLQGMAVAGVLHLARIMLFVKKP